MCKGLTRFSINIMTGLATFPRSAYNLRGGESGWPIRSVCLLMELADSDPLISLADSKRISGFCDREMGR